MNIMVSDILSFTKITGLALADSVNPCEMAVLTMILMTILIQNPDKRKKVLYAGLAFVTSVFIAYLVYGIILIEIFKTFAEFLRENSVYVYDGLGILSMILGALNIKDFFFYKKGGFATEMPIFLRPKVKRIISGITSTKGAFIIGFVVTLFLLPCTMGPYIVASGLLAELGIINAFPWLVYYNLIFVLPMIAIVLLVYYGFSRVEEVSGWKEKHVKKLHLVAGVLLFLIGLGLIMRWF